MNNTAYEIASFLFSAVQEKFADDFSDVPAVKHYWHNCIFSFFSYVNCRRLFQDEQPALERMLEIKLVPQYIYAFCKCERARLNEKLQRALSVFSSSSISVNTLREVLLNYEIDFSGDYVSLYTDKVNRDNTGSYYTPPSLAKCVVKKALQDRLFSANENYRIADFSCGGGDFLLAVVDCLESEYGIHAEKSVTWLYGVDIDPVALQICITSLLLRAGDKSAESIASHFTFGNPLIENNAPVSEEERNYLFSVGRLYSPQMGIPSSFFGTAFDVVVGNPPWEKIRFEERKFFRGVDNAIASIAQKSARDLAVERLKGTWPSVFFWREAIYQDYLKMNSSSYSHHKISASVSGELNTYALFTEFAYNMLSDGGILALIVKSTLVTAPAHQKVWSMFLSNKNVKGVFLFENSQKIFDIDSRERFAVFVAAKAVYERFEFNAGLSSPEMIESSAPILLTADDVLRINPLTHTLPNVNNKREIAFLRDVHRQFKLFSEVYPNCHFGRLIHLTAHSAYIDKQPLSDNVPIYEGKFIEQYDGRYATFRDMSEEKKYAGKASAMRIVPKTDAIEKELPESRFFVHSDLWNKYLVQYSEQYSLCWRSLTSPTNRRTMLAMVLPTCPTCQSIQMLQTDNYEELLLLLALFNSIPFDYLVRIKMPGLDLTQSVIRQIPVPSESDYCEIFEINGRIADLKTHILSYAIYLLRNESRLDGLMSQFKERVYDIRGLEQEEAKKIVDLLFKKAYHLSDSVYKEILATFPKYQVSHSA